MADDEEPINKKLGRTVIGLDELERLERQARSLDPAGQLARLSKELGLASAMDYSAREMLGALRTTDVFDVVDLRFTAGDELQAINKQLAESSLFGSDVSEFPRGTEALWESTAGQLIREVESQLQDLQLPFFNQTVRQLFAQQQEARDEMLRGVADDVLVQTLDSLLDVHGLSAWAEEISETLSQPQWGREIQKAAELFGDMDLQRRLATELYREPDWRELMDSAVAGERADSDTSEAPLSARNGARLREQANRALRRVLPSRLLSKRVRNAVGGVIILAGFASDYATLRVITAGQDQLKSEHGALAQQLQRLQFARAWTLEFGQPITLREQPLANIQERTQLLGPARVIELRRTKGWIEVEAWDCDGEHHTGWIQTHETNDLDPADREVCHPGNALPQLIVEAGNPFIQAWDELFSTELRTEHTRQTYQRACRRFLDFCGMNGLSLDEIQGLHISAWRDILAEDKSSSTVRQSLIALRRLFDAFVARQLLPMNPARSIPLPRRTRS